MDDLLYVPLIDCPKCNGLILDGNWCIDCNTYFKINEFGELEEILVTELTEPEEVDN